jgi:hypothetical protein
MGYVMAIILLCWPLADILSPYTSQSQPVQYNYKLNGRVTFNKSQTRKGATVYVLSNRPAGGRIPFTHADKDGKFSIEYADIPGEYRVYAHEGETGGLLPLAATHEEPKKMQIKQGYSEPIQFGKKDSEQCVIVRLK